MVKVGPGELTDKAFGCRASRCQVAADRAADGGINRLKQWRGIATRFDKRAVNYRAGAVIVSLLWLA
jgi:transposase